MINLKHTKPTHLIARRYVFLFFAAFFNVQICLASTDASFSTLQTQFSDISSRYYRSLTGEPESGPTIKDSISELHTDLSRLLKTQQLAQANAMLLANFALILDKLSTEYTPLFLGQLLESQLFDEAQQLSERALAHDNTFLSSHVHYLLGQHFFERGDLSRSIQHLTAIPSGETLSQMQQNYAKVMFGIALQQNKKHRQALTIYKKIPVDSTYYVHAQLNTAIANIRQGWWTDAQLAIEKALEVNASHKLDDINNRLLLILAYSQLQNEFYRTARNNFRKIHLTSRYANKALLGIGLCALNQKDYAGALNAFNRLKTMPGDDLSVLESNLLVPYTYQKLGDNEEATLTYTEAIALFEGKIREYEFKQRSFDDVLAEINHSSPSSELKSAVQQYQQLATYDVPKKEKKLIKDIDQLKKLLQSHIINAHAKKKSEKTQAVKSYLSQSQYGLAALYDDK